MPILAVLAKISTAIENLVKRDGQKRHDEVGNQDVAQKVASGGYSHPGITP
jgi:hypothetical protein